MIMRIFSPAKLIFTGEHTVVYGYPALAAALDIGVYLQCKNHSENDHVNFTVKPLMLSIKYSLDEINALFSIINDLSDDLMTRFTKLFEYLSFDQILEKTIVALFLCTYYLLKDKMPKIDVHVVFDVPIGSGLGSSASYNSCLAAMVQALRRGDSTDSFSETDRAEICQLAFQLEHVCHGTPSGLDNHVSVYGGYVVAQSKRFKSLEVALDASPSLLIIDTGVARNTQQLVTQVREALKTDEQVVAAFDRLTEISRQIIDFFTTGAGSLPHLLVENHRWLTQLGVSHPRLDTIVELAARYGFASKLTGAGGGGCAFVYLDGRLHDGTLSHDGQSNADDLVKSFTDEGFHILGCSLSDSGLTIEFDSDS